MRHSVNAARIHGNRSQAQRTEALAGFKSGKYRVLVATDIAARGIDVEALSHVVNFDVPAVPDDYIHRVGRTGRAELTGDAFTFVAPEEEADLRAIERAIGRTLPRVTLPDFDYKARPQAQARDSARRAHRRDPRAQGGGARPRQANAERRGGGAARPGAPHARTASPRARPAGPHARPGRIVATGHRHRGGGNRSARAAEHSTVRRPSSRLPVRFRVLRAEPAEPN